MSLILCVIVYVSSKLKVVTKINNQLGLSLLVNNVCVLK